MPIPKKYYEQMQASRAEESRRANSDLRRDLIRTAAICWGWALLGSAFIMWSAHTTSERLGWVSFYFGCVVFVAGQCWTLLAAYRRGEQRGDW